MKNTIIILLSLILTQTCLFAQSMVPQVRCDIGIVTTTKTKRKSSYSRAPLTRKDYSITSRNSFIDELILKPNTNLSLGSNSHIKVNLEITDRSLKSALIKFTRADQVIKQKINLDNSQLASNFYDIEGEFKTIEKASNNPKLFGPKPEKNITQKITALCEVL